MRMLDIKDLVGGYGSVQILNGASLKVDRGQIVALLGGNGTGKSTLLKATSGLIKPWSGSITFDGQRIDGLRPDKIVRRGLVQVTQGKEAFPGMTVEENLRLGAYTVGDRAKTASALERVYGYFPILKEKRSQLSGTLSGGQLQMVCIGRGLMSSPKMIMLDEPSAALAPQVVMGHLPHYPSHHARRHDGADGRAERAHGPAAGPVRLRHQGWRDPHRRAGREPHP